MASSPSRLRDEYNRSSPRAREEYDPTGRLRDDYESSPPRVRHDYDHSPQSRSRNDYEQTRNDYEEYERSRARDRDEYDHHSPTPHLRDYNSPSRGIKDDYSALDDYEDSQDPRRRGDEVEEDDADEDEELHFNLQESTTNPAASSSSSARVLNDYGDNRLRNDFDYEHPCHIDDYSLHDDYPHHPLHNHSLQRDPSDGDDYRDSEGDYEGYGRHYREVIESASPTRRNPHHFHQHHHRHQHHHLAADARQVSQ